MDPFQSIKSDVGESICMPVCRPEDQLLFKMKKKNSYSLKEKTLILKISCVIWFRKKFFINKYLDFLLSETIKRIKLPLGLSAYS